MIWIYELLWLWNMIGIALSATVISIAVTLLLCRVTQRNLSKTAIALIGVTAFLLALFVVAIMARTPMLI